MLEKVFNFGGSKTQTMKFNLLFVILFLFSFAGISQDTLVNYLDNHFIMVSKDSANIIRTVVVNDERYTIIDNLPDGHECGYIELKSLDPRIPDGLSRTYRRDYSLYAKGIIKTGFLMGNGYIMTKRH